MPAAEIPETVTLTIDGARTVRIKAVDIAGRPLAGVKLAPWLLRKEGRRSEVNFASQSTVATADNQGVATFDWLPRMKDFLVFWPRSDGFADRRIIVGHQQDGPVTATLIRTETIRGRVVRPDGTPAPGIKVRANGSGQGYDNGSDRARSASDGSYVLNVSPAEAYAVSVDDADWAAPSRLGVVVLAGKPIAGVDFQLFRGTVVRGRITTGIGNPPTPTIHVRLTESAGQAPEEVREAGDQVWREVRCHHVAWTDAEGRYSTRVGPGTYTLVGPEPSRSEVITITDQPEIIRDFWMRPPSVTR